MMMMMMMMDHKERTMMIEGELAIVYTGGA
jgi:hypothetical protein